ncbi:MAG: octanoyltransferase [Piscirickettsiaceae bacterium]|nr:MAG: octanoyltransferase [Piscirickettsiaceae bacterium]
MKTASNTEKRTLVIRRLGQQDYHTTWLAMKNFCSSRNDNTSDEVWFVEHPPVFTQGVSGKPEHIHNANGIPIVQSDRGGQVTYHGPGQLIMYVLFDLQRLGIGVRTLVDTLELATINVLKQYGLTGIAKKEAPGVYIDDKKIASLGLRVKKGYSYHGLSLNVDMDLTPFSFINPCGYEGLDVTQLANLNVKCLLLDLVPSLIDELKNQLGYNELVAANNLLET